MVESFDIVYYTLAFVVPGFVLESLLKKFIPRETQTDNHNLLHFLSLSFLNYAVWSWLIYIVIKNEYFAEHAVLTGFVWFGIIFIGPIIIATAILFCYKFRLFSKVTAFFKLNPIHPIPTSWDYTFSKINEKKWVIVILDDSTQIAGLWWENSFASSSPSERDIYLEEVYTISDDSAWEKVPRTDGIYIKGERIKLIQFWNDTIKEDM